MVDRALVLERLKLLEGYISDLEAVQAISFAEFEENKVMRRFVERTLHLAIEACLDIGSHIISASGYREPLFGREVMDILMENGWLTSEDNRHLAGMVGFRNILVHDYATIDLDIVFQTLQNRVQDLRRFGDAVLAPLEQGGLIGDDDRA